MTNKTTMPDPPPVADQECSDRFESGYGGMSLLDYFAAKALQGLLSNQVGRVQSSGARGWSFTNCTADDVADLSYAMAEAMLKTRANLYTKEQK